MEIKIILEIPALDKLLASGAVAGLTAGGAGAPADDKPARAPRKAADKTPPPADKDIVIEVEEQDDAATGPSIDDVKAVAKRYNGKMGRDAMAALIEKFGGTSVSTIPEDKRQAFIDEAEIDLD